MNNTKGYKAFAPGMICRGKQYKENTDYEESGNVTCGKGMMHYCVNPFDTLNYYDLVNKDGNFSEFAEVEALETPVSGPGGKFATKKIHIGAKLSFTGFIKACIDYTKEQTIDKEVSDGTDSRNSAQIGSSGKSAKIGSSGDYAKINSTGTYSVICCAGAGSKVKAKVGSWITLSEWAYSDEKGMFIPKCVKTEYVDGEKIKADTWYRLENGEFVEVE